MKLKVNTRIHKIKSPAQYRADFESWSKKQCNKLTKKQQAVTVLFMMFLFICLSLGMVAISLYNIGINDGKQYRREQITTSPVIHPNTNTLNREYGKGN